MLIEKYEEGAAAKHATPRKNGNKKWWALVITLIVIMLLAVTCPSKDDHKDALSGDISTAVTNNVTVRRVKKFNLVNYVSECLVPQNDVTTSNSFKSFLLIF